MTRNPPEWAYLVDETGRYWYHLGNGTRQPVTGDRGERPPGKTLFAIATNDLISVPQWVSSKDPEIISEVVEAEITRLGFHRNGGPGKVSDWKPVELNGTRTLVQTVTTPWKLEELSKSTAPGEFVGFFPQYALYPPPENAAVLWREGSNWVAGYSRGRRWIHVQTLGGEDRMVANLCANVAPSTPTAPAAGSKSGETRPLKVPPPATPPSPAGGKARTKAV
jgi:hypothetical protein